MLTDTIDKKFLSKTKRQIRFGFGFICILLILNLVFQALRGYSGLTPLWAFSIGMDMFGVAVCAAIYYSCMRGSEGVGENTVLFTSLLIVNAIGLFLDGTAWMIEGIPEFATLNRILNAFLFVNNNTIIYMFWSYAVHTLSLDEKLARPVKRLLFWLYIPFLILCLANIFTPIYFSVSEAGVYERTAMFPLSMVFSIIVLPPFILGLFSSPASGREKLGIASFFILPIIGQVISALHFGITTQQAAALLSIVLIHGIVVADRERRLEATKTELDMAARIQAAMMPQIFPPYPDRPEFDIYATMDPAKEVGGDFYDFFLIDEDHLCLVMADVAGKGVPASLYMMICKIILQNCAMLGQSAKETLVRTNEALCYNNQTQMFVTTWLGILEISTGRLTAANAGHEYPALRRPDGCFEFIKDKHGLVLGAMEDAVYKEYELQLEPGTKLFLYTDGVPEATNAKNEMFGLDRALAALNEVPEESPKAIVDNVTQSVGAFVKGAEQFDDLTILCMEYRGKTR